MSTSRTGAPATVSDDEIRSLPDRYRCPVPFHVVRTRLLGNIASPDMTASPMDTVAGLSGGELPALDNVDALRGMTPISDRDRPNLSAGEALASRSKPQLLLRLRTTLQSSLARSRGCQFYWQCTAAAQADYIVIRHREQRHFPAGPCGATQVMRPETPRSHYIRDQSWCPLRSRHAECDGRGPATGSVVTEGPPPSIVGQTT